MLLLPFDSPSDLEEEPGRRAGRPPQEGQPPAGVPAPEPGPGEAAPPPPERRDETP